ncbi:hypothetical protein [Streptomyces sp. MZ04]|uniref:hypothetical protein n=1 Tax=Streptomyces sp. MZ04 TaxID=2559236 RepID=UPI00107EE1D4|nr:hypothetical protein [Streptomyces sp. MZ04]TGB13876.1 hypothetical protein E2651_08020 [Streptomyces sp. MZ04]
MHDHPPDLTEYEWPVCVTPGCGRQLWVSESGRWACRPCEDKTATRLTELPALFRQLDTTAALMRGARRIGGGGSGTKNPPIPPRLEVLDLVAPGGGVAARLRAIEDSWRTALDWEIAPDSDGNRIFASWRINPAEAVKRHTKFLADNLLWACGGYESVGHDVETIRKLHAECTAIVNDERKPGRVKIGLCPVQLDDGLCREQLTASAASHRVRCSGCGSGWETLGEWRQLRAAQEAVLAEAAGVAA